MGDPDSGTNKIGLSKEEESARSNLFIEAYNRRTMQHEAVDDYTDRLLKKEPLPEKIKDMSVKQLEKFIQPTTEKIVLHFNNMDPEFVREEVLSHVTLIRNSYWTVPIEDI